MCEYKCIGTEKTATTQKNALPTVANYLLLKRPPYWPPIDTSWPSIDIQLLLQQKCCDNGLLSSIWPLSGPLVTLIWGLVSTNTLTMPKRMRGTRKLSAHCILNIHMTTQYILCRHMSTQYPLCRHMSVQ